ncbi:DNA polymerase III subunit alpha [Spirosoma endbachense]|uniref:DNA-directed DNA polymerase n=1 Tax=Spirosoma endbachense TaxID=2666025 RepID=A0A6P1W1A7_9BACT|nr:DNA polymerase III subunit alpha [Spirosoma endbachense]QHV97769.1 DNA polymerase III subunit alpha [Spirosoma endbachense]
MYLNAHSYYSLRYGTLSPEALVQHAQRLGVTHLALTDINTISGVFDFVQHCLRLGIQPVVGIEIRSHQQLRYICLARNTEGFAEINRFVSQYLLTHQDFPAKAPSFQHAYVIYPLDQLDRLGGLAAHERIGVRPSEVSRLWRYRQTLRADQVVVLQPITYLDKTDYNLHKLLRAIDHNCLLAHLAERETIRTDEYWPTPDQLQTSFRDWPMVLANTQALLDSCSFAFDFDSSKNRQLYTPSRADDIALLRKLAEDGLRDRYGPEPGEALQRVESELAIIDQLNFTAYFLITWNIITYAHSRGYYHVGRGSGANSIVAYCLGITDVDPIELDLYFERFINPNRSSPPDFDLDFSWSDRDELTDYIFKTYGQEHVCLMATYVTFRDRAAYRELGKVFGLPKAELDSLINGPGHASPGTASQEPDLKGEYMRYILRYAPLLEDFPNYLGIHAGGILIAQQPLYQYTALEMPPKGFPLCQFDMYVAEAIGFAKWDVLSQRGLGHIKEAVEWVRVNRQVSVDIHRIQDFKRDETVRQQLLAHETMGCFYIESPAMRQLIWKLGCLDYRTLVAASSIIRPGVASSGMMAEYIRRHHNPTSYTPIHPRMQELLAETYGVMIYQEDVLKVAHHFGGLSLADADVLRRAMSGKQRGKTELARIEETFFANCQAKGYSEAVTREVWRQIQSFSGYSFSKAHSASFAVESYQSLYLKAHYPLEFMTAVINNFGGFYSTEFYVHEARRYGARIEAPDVHQSHYLTRLEGKTIWLGFIHIKGLEKAVVTAMLAQRSEQAFLSLDEFTRQVPIGLEQLILLIRVGVFRSLGVTKKELLWQAHALVNNYVHHQGVADLFDWPELYWALPTLWQDPLEDIYDEMELLGFSLSSPFRLLAEPVSGIQASELASHVGEWIRITGYLVTYKRITARNGKPMVFGYFVDEQGSYFDTTHFPHTLALFPLRGYGLYQLEGKVVLEFGFPSLEVKRLEKCAIQADPRLG